MNEIRHMTLSIDLDIWQPKSKQAMKDIDELVFKLKEGKLLGNCGNVKLTMREGTN